MEHFLQRFALLVAGVLSGFDRLVFKGKLCPLYSPEGMNCLLNANYVAHKEFKEYAKQVTARVIETSGVPQAKAQGCYRYLNSSKIDKERQEALRTKFHSLRLQEGGTPSSALLFRGSPQLGANAFTLPDGTIIVLDELVTAMGDDQQILAVLAHELGHVHGRHGLQLLLRSSAVGAFWTFYIGDVSSLLAAAPAAVVEAKYSQELERQADDYAAALLLHNGLSPGLLADALQKLTESHPDASKAGFLATHPSTHERMRRLRQSSRPAPPD